MSTGISPAFAERAAQAALPFTHNFEGGDDFEFHIVPGQKSDGSVLSLSNGAAHSGRHALKLDFKFTGSGFLQFIAESPAPIPDGNALHVASWIKGTAAKVFDGATVRLLDATNETYQYPLTPDFSHMLNGEDWQPYGCDIDFTKAAEHWGGKGDGKIDFPLRFLGFSFSHRSENSINGTILMDDVSFAAQTKKTAGLVLEQVWPHETPATYLYPPNSRVTIRARISENADGQYINWIARDFDGKVVARWQDRRNAQTSDWILPAGKPGILYVTAEIRSADGAPSTCVETRVAYLSTPRSGTAIDVPLIWGVNSHPERCTPEDLEREAALISQLGFSMLRGGPGWISVQPNGPNEWNWAGYDNIYAALGRHGVRWAGEFLGTPKWASTGKLDSMDWTDWGFAPPRRQEDFANFVTEAVKRYGDRTQIWEVWNEPDVSFWRGTPEAYATIFDTAYEAIKRVQPNAQVINGGFSETKRSPDFIPRFIQAAKHRPDAFAFHTHMQFSNLLRAESEMQQYRRNTLWESLPVFLNEAGFSSSRQLSERDQAAALVKKMAYSAALGHQAYFWYDLRNDGNDPNELEANFGLVRRDFTPKAAAVAARTLIRNLSGKRFVRRLPAADGVYVLLFEGKGPTGKPETSAVVWNESPSEAQLPLIWQINHPISRINVMGIESALTNRGRLVVTSALPMPEFLRIPGLAASVSLAKDVLKFETTIPAAKGNTHIWHATLTNPWKESWHGELRLQPENGWTATPATTRFDLKAAETRALEFSISAPEGAQPSILKIDLVSPRLPATIKAAAQLTPALLIPQWPTAGQKDDFSRWTDPFVRLRSPNSVSLYEATPMQNLHFHGDADLSADAYAAHVSEGLLLAVDVRDDHHVSVDTSGEEWKGDSLQFAISLPNGATYEWTCALTERGPRAVLTGAPAGVTLGTAMLPLTIKRVGDRTQYEVTIPNRLPDATSDLPAAFGFNLLVNDNDGDGRKGWVEFRPGIGRSKDPTQFQQFLLR